MLKITAENINGTLSDLDFSFNGEIYTLSREALIGRQIDKITVECDLLTHSVGNGYLFYPTNFVFGCIRTNLIHREGCEFYSDIATMPCAGIGGNGEAVMFHAVSGYCDLRFKISVKDDFYKIQPEFVLDGDEPEEDISFQIIKKPFGTYSDFAKIYRAYQLDNGCRPIRERHNPYLNYAAESIELRIRMGWKPVPTPYMFQTKENEPPMKVACDTKKLEALIDEMEACGIKKAEICLVGWNIGGHDGRFPQIFPSDERLGGDEALKCTIKKAQQKGYQIVAHTNSECAYTIAENFDETALVHIHGTRGCTIPMIRENYYNSGGLSGGAAFRLCARPAYEQYGKYDLPELSAFGFRGLHFIDELTACTPQKCYNPKHPLGRKGVAEYYRKLARLATEQFGGYQSEAWFDFFMSDVDSIMYTAVIDEPHLLQPLFDETIPFWQIVYHGIVLSNPSSATVNYPIKDKRTQLRFIEYGGRPLMYLYSKFGEKKDWMGKDDLTADNHEDLVNSVKILKAAYDEFESLKHLQFEFIENHEKLSSGIYKTTYSDGTAVTVDYNAGNYKVEKE